MERFGVPMAEECIEKIVIQVPNLPPAHMEVTIMRPIYSWLDRPVERITRWLVASLDRLMRRHTNRRLENGRLWRIRRIPKVVNIELDKKTVESLMRWRESCLKEFGERIEA